MKYSIGLMSICFCSFFYFFTYFSMMILLWTLLVLSPVFLIVWMWTKLHKELWFKIVGTVLVVVVSLAYIWQSDIQKENEEYIDFLEYSILEQKNLFDEMGGCIVREKESDIAEMANCFSVFMEKTIEVYEDMGLYD